MFMSPIRRQPVGHAGHVVFLNNTASSYHWGCYATSMMLVNGLTEQGFAVTSFDVETTHFGLGASSPQTVDEVDSVSYRDQISAANPMLYRALTDCDMVVVNGEGTLHRFHNGPRALLSLMRMARVHLGKPVHLVNHSCYPSGTGAPAEPHVEDFYRLCLSVLDRVVFRDEFSGEVYHRLGIKAEPGFDCLPLYHDRYLKPLPRVESRVLLGAASNWDDQAIASFCDAFLSLSSTLRPRPLFLSGGFRREPNEDARHYAALKVRIPDLGIVRPASISEWMAWIQAAPIMITGRYHHLVAGAALRTPMVIMPGNTSKNDATCRMLGLPAPISPHAIDFGESLRSRMLAPVGTSRSAARTIVAAAEKNLGFS